MNFIRSGFRAIRDNPALFLAEIAWRWTFGLIAWLLLLLAVRIIMEGIDITGVEAALARRYDAFLIADALVRILVQVLPRLAHALYQLVPALAFIWIATTTLGRAATLVILSEDAPPDPHSPGFGEVGAGAAHPSRRTFCFSLISLHTLRALFTIATFLAFFGTIILVSAQFSPDVAGLAILGWLCLAFVVGCFWALVNWFLSLAAIFIVRDRLGPWRALSASLGLYRDHRAAYMTIASWFGLFRGAALLFAIIAASVVAASASLRIGIVGSILVALAYFAFADYLYIARLAAFAELAGNSAVGTATPMPTGPPPAPASPSDVSHLELET